MCDLLNRGLGATAFKGMADRRTFLRAAGAATLTLAVPPGLIGGTALAAGTEITATHGAGFCNLNLFLSHVLNTVKEEGVDLKLITTPTFADEITMIGAGQIDVGIMPYTTFLALYDSGVPVKIVGGGGVGGVGIVAQPGITKPEDFKGKTIGTFQLDTLEIMAYDWFKKQGVNYKDLTIRYFDTTPESAQAFMSGAVDILTTIEPYGTIILKDKPGATMLSNGSDIYGTPFYSDCILGIRAGLIDENPKAIKALIKGMMEAQLVAEQDPEGTLNKLLGSYYKTDMERGKLAMSKQPSVIDARSQTQFILDRGQSLMEMGYIKRKPDASVLDWSFLEAVIAENPETFSKLKYKS
ncbi:ABC transporter substrate-binding protein [Skermanella stibiiresistens SB22]|uniref:ABC transporter substrate-binding protein n=1 Tax=Skermanella stibiiresistens SB22 TaxID=1385369 RepID=W9H3N7_9PROT|nr:ABC transporter substrate-binding protein [Skermanella stibiiresistens]EWY40810.1 ABC transporter substrate-binding protein [Skermanella stibiiresistens SB22]